jgi:hypothetical protein
MHRPPLDQLILLVLQDSALVALLIRFWWMGLYRTYPCFFCYLLGDLLQTVIVFALPFDGPQFPYVWVATEGLVVFLFCLIVLELYRVIFRDLAGIATLSRRYIKATLAVSILVSLLLRGLEETPANMVSTFLLFERAAVCSLLFFILLITAFLAYYPIALNRNLLAYLIGLAVYFLTKATALFIRNLGHYWSRYLSTVLLAVFTACLLFWLFTLTRRGEMRSVVIARKWKPEEEETLLLQLRTINNNLLGVAFHRKQTIRGLVNEPSVVDSQEKWRNR